MAAGAEIAQDVAAGVSRAGMISSSTSIPAASWWARTVVESTLTSDRSVLPSRAVSAIKPSGRASNTPASRQARNRPKTVDQGPISQGISRHWALDRNRQITPSN